METLFVCGVKIMLIKMKYYGLLLPENVSAYLKSYGILWLFSNLGVGSSFIIFLHFFIT